MKRSLNPEISLSLSLSPAHLWLKLYLSTSRHSPLPHLSTHDRAAPQDTFEIIATRHVHDHHPVFGRAMGDVCEKTLVFRDQRISLKAPQ